MGFVCTYLKADVIFFDISLHYVTKEFVYYFVCVLSVSNGNWFLSLSDSSICSYVSLLFCFNFYMYLKLSQYVCRYILIDYIIIKIHFFFVRLHWQLFISAVIKIVFNFDCNIGFFSTTWKLVFLFVSQIWRDLLSYCGFWWIYMNMLVVSWIVFFLFSFRKKSTPLFLLWRLEF